MEMRLSSTALVTGLVMQMLSMSFGVSAEEECFSGGQETGQLGFSGAVEGTGFTGGFGEFSVEYCIPPSGPSDGRIDVRVQLSSADTENRERDETLKGESFFAVDQYPEAAWKSRAIEADGSGYIADGRLELKGIEAEQAVKFTLTRDGDDLLVTGGFSMRGDAEVERLRFDVGSGEFADPEFVRNRVDVSFELGLRADD